MYGKFIDMIWCDCCCQFAVSLQIFHTPAIRKQRIGAIIGVQNLCALKNTINNYYQNQSNISFHELQKRKNMCPVNVSSRLVEGCKSPSQQEGANSAAEARKPQAMASYHGIFFAPKWPGAPADFPSNH